MRENRRPAGGTRRSWRLLLGMAVLGVFLGCGLAGLIWRLTGGHWLVVQSPSMGQVAPVGTLVLTRPVSADAVRVGDIISYRVPVKTSEIITHRVVAITNGVLHTKGDINVSPDPWDLHSADLVGRAVSLWWGVGWLLKAVPILLAGALVIWVITRFWVPLVWRNPLRLFGASIVVAIAAIILRPFVGMVLIMTDTDPGVGHVYLVSTGLLPIRVSAPDGAFLDLVDGQVGILNTTSIGPHQVPLTSHPHLSWWGWGILALIWLVPLFWALASGPAPESGESTGGGEDPDGSDGPDPGPGGDDLQPIGADDVRRRLPPPGDPGLLTHTAYSRRRRRWVPVVLAAALIAAMAATTGTSTAAAFVAKIGNSTNTAATGVFNTCTAATGAIGAASTVFTYPLGDAVPTATTAADLSGNARPGTYTGAFSTNTSHPCPRDTSVSTAVTLAPTAAAPSYVYNNYKTTVTNVFTEAIWFKTTTTTGGRLIGWSTLQTGQSNTYDRHVYMANSGQIVFGVYPNGVKVVTSPLAYNDNKWHQAVATLSAAGMALYLDGALVASDSTTIYGENSGGTLGGPGVEQGYWRVAFDSVSGWTSQPSTFYFTGSLAWASVFTVALTAPQVQTLYTAGT